MTFLRKHLNFFAVNETGNKSTIIIIVIVFISIVCCFIYSKMTPGFLQLLLQFIKQSSQE